MYGYLAYARAGTTFYAGGLADTLPTQCTYPGTYVGLYFMLPQRFLPEN